MSILVKQNTSIDIGDVIGDALLKDIFHYLHDSEKEVIIKTLELEKDGLLEVNSLKIKGYEFLVASLTLSDNIIHQLMGRGIKGIQYVENSVLDAGYVSYIKIYNANRSNIKNNNKSKYRKYTLTNGFILYSKNVDFTFENL